jgi:hypothetical protein
MRYGWCIFLWLCFSQTINCFVLDAKTNTLDTYALYDDSGTLFLWGDFSETERNYEVQDFASTTDSFAALLTSGQIKVWGNTSDPNLSNVNILYANNKAYAAILTNRKIVCWGFGAGGGDCRNITDEILKISATYEAFAAITSDYSVETWGNPNSGGDSDSVAAYLDSNTAEIFSTDSAFVAHTFAGPLICWGNPLRGGSCSNLVSSTDVKEIYSTAGAFAVLTTSDQVITWGSSGFGGDTTSVAPLSSGVQFMISGETDFIAFTKDSTLVSWGGQGIQYKTPANPATQLYSNYGAFVALDSTGLLTIWGAPRYGGGYTPSSSSAFSWVYSNKYAFVGVTTANKIVCWDDGQYGGSCSSMSNLLVKQLAAIEGGFIAVTCEGSVVGWGTASNLLPIGIQKPTLIGSNHRYSRSSKDVVDDTVSACGYPTLSPTFSPTLSARPTFMPTTSPPSSSPTSQPSAVPTLLPTTSPTLHPTAIPSSAPSSSPTSLPTGIPTSVPSCPALYTHEDGTAACACKAGYYTQYDPLLLDSHTAITSLNTSCLQCPHDHFSDTVGVDSCTQCPWPETTRSGRGNTECSAYCLCFSQNALMKIIPPVLVVFLLCIALANESKYALAIVLFFPTLDVLTDVLYLATTLYYTPLLCFCSVCFLLAPSLLWVHELHSKGAAPTLLVWPFPGQDDSEWTKVERGKGEEEKQREGEEKRGEEEKRPEEGKKISFPKPNYKTDLLVITISSSSFTPLYRGIPIKPFFNNHDGLPHLFSFFAIWMAAGLYQLVIGFIFFIWFSCSLIFQSAWFLLGIFLHLTKLFTIGRVQTFWFYLWTGGNRFECDRDVDIGTLNRDMLAEFLMESLPQLLVQSINNQLTHKWTLIGWISAALSMFVALNGTYRMLYWVIWMKVPIDQVQMGLALKMLGAKSDLHHPNSPTEGSEIPNRFELERGQGGGGQKGVEMTPKRRSFGDAKVVPVESSKGANDIFPFTPLKSGPPISPSESLSGVDTNIEGPRRNSFVPPPETETAGDGKDEESERIWRTSIWDLIIDTNNSLDQEMTHHKMASVGLGSIAEIRYLNEHDIELIGATMKPVPRRKLRFLWGGRLVKTQAYLQVPDIHDMEESESKREEAEGMGGAVAKDGDLIDLSHGGESMV